jgi:Fe-S-cluster-containing dehydrogenase component
MRIGRRSFIQMAGVTAGAGLVASSTARASTPDDDRLPGVLVDTTRCVGCRACEAACAETNELPPPPEGDQVFKEMRDTSTTSITEVNKANGERFAKKQCLHCLAPACASACPVTALKKLPTGPVTYDAGKCMGCRYCMVACPFNVPKYEYEKLAPRVRKCTFCAPRQAQGLPPACTEVCPSGALTFGLRHELMEEAKRRIYSSTSRYARRVYGEREAGGTSWFYISDVPMETLGLQGGVPEKPYPELVSGALGAPPLVMTLWPPLLMGLYAFSKRREETDKKEGGEAHHG